MPILAPFSFHWKVGDVPPFVGIAVNVTLVPAHTVVAGLAEIPIVAVTFGLTVIVILFDVAGLPITHVALLVISQDT